MKKKQKIDFDFFCFNKKKKRKIIMMIVVFVENKMNKMRNTMKKCTY